MKTALIHPFIPRQEPTVTGGGDREFAARPALEPLWAPVVIRLATASDQLSLDYLAQLDSARPPTGATLIGELRGRPVVAVALSDGTTIADPFAPTGDILELVRLRAGQLNQSGRSRWRPRAIASARPRTTSES